MLQQFLTVLPSQGVLKYLKIGNVKLNISYKDAERTSVFAALNLGTVSLEYIEDLD